MIQQLNLFTILLLLSAASTGYLAVVLNQRAGQARKFFGLMMAFLSVWALTYGFELESTQLEWMLFWIKLEYIGIALIPGFWLMFCISYSGNDKWLTPRIIAGVFLLPILTIVVVWTNSLHFLHYSQVGVNTEGPFPLLSFVRGPWYWLHTAYFYSALLTGTILLLRNYQIAAPLFRKQTLIVLSGALLPWVVNLMYLSGYRPFGYVDLTPVVFSVSGIIIGYGLLQYKLFNIVPLARDKVVEGMFEGVMVLDTYNRIIDMNPAMRWLLSDLPDAVIGSDITTLLPEQTLLLSMVTNKVMASVELTHVLNKAELILEVNATPIFKKDGTYTGLLLVWRDITQQKKTQDELVRSKQKSEESDRLKTAFLANMSHEIRNPLNGIIGFTELLRDENLTPGEKDNYIEVIDRSAHHLLDLINDIIDISKIEAGLEIIKNEPLDVSELIRDLEAFFRAQAELKHIEFTIHNHLSAEHQTVFTDSRKLRQILLNLIGNAFKFTDHGFIKVDIKTQDNALVFRVSDSGIGISKKDQEVIFDRFRRADHTEAAKRKGTGLGLSISRGYTELMNGTLKLTSVPGSGSIFTLQLPLDKSGFAEEKPKAAARKNLPDWKGKVILIVEDEPVNIMYVQLSLKQTGVEMLTASNGLEAVEWAKKRTDIDLIVMDIKMPEMDGFEATETIRSFNKTVPIVALSGHALLQVPELQERGFNAMISKPVRRQLLLDRLGEFL